MQLGKQHNELDDNGEGKCSVPMWVNGCPAGLCDEVAYGHQLSQDRIYRRGPRQPYCHGLACVAHGGPPKGFVDDEEKKKCERCLFGNMDTRHPRLCMNCDREEEIDDSKMIEQMETAVKKLAAEKEEIRIKDEGTCDEDCPKCDGRGFFDDPLSSAMGGRWYQDCECYTPPPERIKKEGNTVTETIEAAFERGVAHGIRGVQRQLREICGFVDPMRKEDEE